jgi:hypothetical protein
MGIGKDADNYIDASHNPCNSKADLPPKNKNKIK